MFSSNRKRPTLSDPGSSSQAQESPEPVYHDVDDSTTRDIDGLWQEALDDYRRSLPLDLLDLCDRVTPVLERCLTSDEILDVLEDMAPSLGKQREGNELSSRLRAALKPLVYGLRVILDAVAETASALHAPAGKGIFTAVAVLLKAADRVTEVFSDLEKLLQRMGEFIGRLKVRVRSLLKEGSRRIVVNTLVEMLKAFELASRLLKRGRIRHFVQVLFSKGDDLKSAIEVLADVTSDEERIVIAELVIGMDRVVAIVDDIKAPISAVQSMHGSTYRTPSPENVVSLSCIVVGVGPGAITDMLARVCVTDFQGQTLVDYYVLPTMQVADYRTATTGIQPQHLVAPRAHPFMHVQHWVKSMIKDKVLVGHSLWKDLSVLGLPHGAVNTRDVGLYQPFRNALKLPNELVELTTLAWKLMHRHCQIDGLQDASENARIALDLYRSHATDWERTISEGRWPTVLPPASFSRCYL